MFGKDARTQQLHPCNFLKVHVELAGSTFNKYKGPVWVVVKEMVPHLQRNRVAFGRDAWAYPSQQFRRVAKLTDHFLQQTVLDTPTTGMNHTDGGAIVTGEDYWEAVCGLYD